MIDGSQPVEKYALPVSKDELAKQAQEYSKIPVELTRNKEQQQEPISGEPAYLPPRLNPATRASKTYGNQLESPILLPALQVRRSDSLEMHTARHELQCLMYFLCVDCSKWSLLHQRPFWRPIRCLFAQQGLARIILLEKTVGPCTLGHTPKTA